MAKGIIVFFSFLLLLASPYLASASGSGLSYDFYKTTCPSLELLVKKEVARIYYIHGNAAISFLRNMFHDCAVQGCDASLLLESVPGHPGEKGSEHNTGMRNFKYVDEIKAAVEKACPGVVSCADIIILSGRDGVAMLGGPQFKVKTGRRDTRKFSLAAADATLLPQDVDVTTFLNLMETFGLDIREAVALIGAHTVGRTHCKNLVKRLYPTVDPTLNYTYSYYLKKRCPTPHPPLKAVLYSRNDPITPMKFDNNYFKNVIQMKGLLKLDNALYLDPRTKPYVVKMAKDNNYFYAQFVEGISILTEYKVLTGLQGEIRKHCKWVN
ncbi:hypothetical protein GOP47_0000491 [Adiantum capillus-veneris]|uniref:Peroxidase n=1 Tax=Adiantum capillus-veneris TaxID=13818 RepID=A0A9D4ZSY5_ADICA|nr:hypothetical protein GOP47_0000491 [Adiantum capillus-veneris]